MIKCAPWVSWGASEAEFVLFDERDGSYHALNASASLIWKELIAGRQPEEICEVLAASRGVAVDLLSADVDAFVTVALEQGLLVPASAS